jgi:hypothetical protein
MSAAYPAGLRVDLSGPFSATASPVKTVTIQEQLQYKNYSYILAYIKKNSYSPGIMITIRFISRNIISPCELRALPSI